MGEKRQLWSQRHPLRMGREVAFSFYLCFRFLLTYIFVCVYVLSPFSHVRLSATPQTVAHQPPLSMGFPKQEY